MKYDLFNSHTWVFTTRFHDTKPENLAASTSGIGGCYAMPDVMQVKIPKALETSACAG